MNIIYKSPFDRKIKALNINDKFITIDKLKKQILHKENIPCVSLDFNIIHNGKKMIDNFSVDDLNDDIFIHLSISIFGGKGGFGSMLRAIGAQIEKTTNREACRDLSGRRLRDVNEEKRIKEWIKKQADRKKEEDKKKREKLRKIAEGNLPSNCQYDDNEYEKFRTEIPEIIDESIMEGLKRKQSTSGKNNANNDNENKSNKRKLKTENSTESSNSSSPSTSSSSSDTITKSDNSDNHKIDDNNNGKTMENTKQSSSSSSLSLPPPKKMAKKQHQNLWLGIDVSDDSDNDSE